MRTAYKCDYCDEVFDSKSDARDHEKSCGRSPDNMITDKTLFRLAMMLKDADDIIACALVRSNADLNHLEEEAERATRDNCPVCIYDTSIRIIRIIRRAYRMTDKYFGKKTIADVTEDEWPFAVEAVKAVLDVPVWNEWED